MAEGDGFLYNNFKLQLVKGEHNFGSGGHTFKVALFTSTFVPNRDNQSSYTALTNECSGPGYTAGGKTLTNLSVLVDNDNDLALIDADNATWNNLGQLTPQPSWAVLYNDSHATKAIVACWEVTTLTNGGNWEIQFSSLPSAMFTLS
jgi:hypothetical protein